MGVGRPTKLTQDLVDLAFEGAKLGMHNQGIADWCGISEETFYDYLRKSKKGAGGLFDAFSEAVRKGRALNAQQHLTIMNGAGTETASKWMLERVHRYTQKTETDVHVTGGEDIGRNASPAERARDAARKLRGS
jgi:predicted transcriptional regulator